MKTQTATTTKSANRIAYARSYVLFYMLNGAIVPNEIGIANRKNGATIHCRSIFNVKVEARSYRGAMEKAMDFFRGQTDAEQAVPAQYADETIYCHLMNAGDYPEIDS